MPQLPPADYRRLFELAVALLDDPKPAEAWPRVLAQLVTDCGADGGIMNATWHTSTGPAGHAWSPGGALPPAAVCSPDHLADHPLARYYRCTADPTPYRIGDVTTDLDWRATTAYRYQLAKCGISRELVIPLPAPTGRLRVVALGRSGPEFTLRDRDYARHAQPLLRHLDALTRHRTPIPPDVLTPRESAVLALLAAGHTAQAIARRLEVSPRTVHAHLRSLYRKLGTTDRLSTVLHARESGLLNPR